MRQQDGWGGFLRLEDKPEEERILNRKEREALNQDKESGFSFVGLDLLCFVDTSFWAS